MIITSLHYRETWPETEMNDLTACFIPALGAWVFVFVGTGRWAPLTKWVAFYHTHHLPTYRHVPPLLDVYGPIVRMVFAWWDVYIYVRMGSETTSRKRLDAQVRKLLLSR